MEQFFKSRNNLIGFEDGLIEKLQKEGTLDRIMVSVQSPKTGKNYGKEEMVNAYYRVNGVENTVFMHVREGYGVLIPEYIVDCAGIRHNVVTEFSTVYWGVYGNNHVYACALGSVMIYRAMWSLALYGDISKKMNTQWQVHHKSYRWWNDLDATTVVCRKKHKHFHKGNGASHQGGLYFTEIEDFINFVKQLNEAKKNVKRKKM